MKFRMPNLHLNYAAMCHNNTMWLWGLKYLLPLYILLCVYTDRQTDILLTEIKVITDFFVIVIREIYVHVHVYTRMLVC